MTEGNPSKRIAVLWSPQARVDLRAIDRDTALQILLDRYLLHREGDIKKLNPPRTGFRLRCGDYRLFFDLVDAAIQITAVRDRKNAYR